MTHSTLNDLVDSLAGNGLCAGERPQGRTGSRARVSSCFKAHLNP